MQDNPFAHLLPQQQAPQQPQPQAPRRIMGAPPTMAPGEAARIGLQSRQVALAERKDAREETKPNLTPAQTAVDKEFAKDYVEWTANGGFSDSQKQERQLEGAIEKLESSDSITGPVVGRLGDWANSFINPEAIATREDVEEVVQRNLRLILGAQFTEKEGERLIARAYNPRLEEAENVKRVKRLLEQMRKASQAKSDAAQYYEENGTLVGWEGSLWSMGDFDPSKDDAGPKTRKPSQNWGTARVVE